MDAPRKILIRYIITPLFLGAVACSYFFNPDNTSSRRFGFVPASYHGEARDRFLSYLNSRVADDVGLPAEQVPKSQMYGFFDQFLEDNGLVCVHGRVFHGKGNEEVKFDGLEAMLRGHRTSEQKS